MEWISVKDRLPSYSGQCICYEPITTEDQIDAILNDEEMYSELDAVTCAIFERESEMFSALSVDEHGKPCVVVFVGVTHWMPLPEPPKI